MGYETIYHTHRRMVSQLEKYSFSEERKNHWPGRCNSIKKTMTLFPCHGHLENRHDTIPLGRYGLGQTSCGNNSKWAFFELWHCSSKGAICWYVGTFYMTQILSLLYISMWRKWRWLSLTVFMMNYDYGRYY
jgi:hypothetical protein